MQTTQTKLLVSEKDQKLCDAGEKTNIKLKPCKLVERRDACDERWRVDEWCEHREGWWVLNHHNTYAKAADQLDYLTKNCAAPKRRWRVVWIRERVQLLSAAPKTP